MDANIYLYYCLNQTNQTVRTSKSGIKSVNILYVPEHISLRLQYNQATQEGFVFPVEKRLVTFPDHLEAYRIIYSLLFPKLNLAKAVCLIESPLEVIRKISIAIVKLNAKQKNFDDWLDSDSSEYLSLR